MPNLSVLVSLGPINNPVVSLDPENLGPEPPGNYVITWSVNPTSPIKNFVFSSLAFNPPTPPCFTNLGISNTQISINDNYSTPATAAYGYTLGVTYNGRIYSSGSGAASAGGTGAAPHGVGGMGSPTIHNK